jgi:hypothetical protein
VAARFWRFGTVKARYSMRSAARFPLSGTTLDDSDSFPPDDDDLASTDLGLPGTPGGFDLPFPVGDGTRA